MSNNNNNPSSPTYSPDSPVSQKKLLINRKPFWESERFWADDCPEKELFLKYIYELGGTYKNTGYKSHPESRMLLFSKGVEGQHRIIIDRCDSLDTLSLLDFMRIQGYHLHKKLDDLKKQIDGYGNNDPRFAVLGEAIDNLTKEVRELKKSKVEIEAPQEKESNGKESEVYEKESKTEEKSDQVHDAN